MMMRQRSLTAHWPKFHRPASVHSLHRIYGNCHRFDSQYCPNSSDLSRSQDVMCLVRATEEHQLLGCWSSVCQSVWIGIQSETETVAQSETPDTQAVACTPHSSLTLNLLTRSPGFESWSRF
uniref:Uncharacterized protein n=1 Tax=Cacopsylla melanoneura TaxID=428564 RepID=A0A8D9B885_9HEMI